MVLGNPIDAWLQMAQNRNQNQQNSWQNIAGIGQGLGQGIGAVGDAIYQKKKQQQWQKTINEAMANPNLTAQQKAAIPFMTPQNVETMGPTIFRQPQEKTVWKPVNLANGNIGVVNGSTGEIVDTGQKAQPKQFAPPRPPVVNPVQAGNLDVKVQQANKPSLMDSLLANFGYKKPQITNPLQQQAQDPLGINR